MFAVGVEVAPGGMVHAHAAVYGEYLTEQAASSRWETAIAWPGEVNIAAMKAATADEFRKSLHEVLKYVTKGDKGKDQAARAASIELAMRSVRRVEMGGLLRKAPKVTTADLVFDGQNNCLECGAVKRWSWTGIKPPGYVAQNRGFGLDRWDDITDADAKNQATLYEAHFQTPAPAFLSGVEL